MITQENFKSVLLSLDFEENKSIFSKSFPHTEGIIKVDFNKKELVLTEVMSFDSFIAWLLINL